MVSDSDKQRLEALSARISKAQEAATPRRWRRGDRKGPSRGMIRAIRIGSDFVAMVMVPTALGGYLDEQFGTGPWLMLALLMLGFGLGFWVLVRALDGTKGKGQDSPEEQEE